MLITIAIDTSRDSLEDCAAALLRMAGKAEQVVRVEMDTSGLQEIIDDLGFPAHGLVPTASAPAAPPPPPAVMLMPDENGDDIEVTVDDDGNVTGMTTAVSLPVAPPPPAPAAPPPPAPIVDAGVFDMAHGLPAAAPLPPGAVAELDARRLPWDGRIHAANRAKTIGEQWKYKRGVDKAIIAAVEAELGVVGASPLAAPTVAATAPAAPPPPAPTVGTVAPAAGAPSAIDFRTLMQKIVAATNAKKLTDDQTAAAMAAVGLGVQDFASLIDKPQLIETVNALIDKAIA